MLSTWDSLDLGVFALTSWSGQPHLEVVICLSVVGLLLTGYGSSGIARAEHAVLPGVVS